MRSLSMTTSVASRWRICLPVRHSLAQLMQLLRVCLGYFDITCSSPSIRQKASASDPANPQQTPSFIFLILRASILTLVLPRETWPSPMMTVQPSRLSARMVVWCHFSLAKPHFKNLVNISIIISMIIPINRSLSVKSQARENVGQEREIINGHGVHDTVQLVLVGLLIIASVTVVFTTNEEINQHDRYLRTYFNLNLLGKNDLGLYEEGLNIDQSQMQFATLDEMKEHFTKILNISNSIEEDGLVAFALRNESIIKFELYTQDDEFNLTTFDTVQQAMAYFHYLETDFFRNLLLSSNQLKLALHLGQNKFVKDYELIAEYKMYSEMMIKAKLDVKYELKSEKKVKLDGLRILQQIISATLFLIYLYQLTLLSHKNRKHRLFSRQFKNIDSLKKKFQYWYFFLQFMCIIILFSQKYAPICAFFQILPIFQFPDREEQEENELYNFNKNLRFSFPLIMTIFFQIFIFLNGFILYSMLMYPGDYFDDYLKGFFSYVYQLFQVGTYEIFTELESYGNFAYMLYALLYFYVFEVGNSLIPALFVIMIEMKVTEKFLKRHVTELINDCACPKCHEKNSHEAGSSNMHIVVRNPKLSPLLNRKKYASQHQSKSEQSDTLMMLYIDEEIDTPQRQGKKFHENYKFSNYSKKILDVARRLQNQTSKYKDQLWLQNCLKKVERELEKSE